MTVKPITLNISTPTEPILPGWGFYQLDEDALFVQVGPFSGKRRFFSYLESDSVHLDFDREGRLIFIEIDVPKRQWRVEQSLNIPDVVEHADVRWLNFRQNIAKPHLATNPDRTLIKLSFPGARPSLNYFLAESVIVQTDAKYSLSAIWITHIIDDKGGREISSYRKRIRLGKPYLGTSE